MSKTRKKTDEHEPRTRKRKIEEARLLDDPLPPVSQADSLRKALEQQNDEDYD